MPLWTVGVAEHPTITCYRQSEPVVAGDRTNPSIFFLVRHSISGVPIEPLILLAAHVVLMGFHFSPNVEGLDMAVCRDGELSMLESKDIENLTRRSGEIDSRLADLLGVPRRVR